MRISEVKRQTKETAITVKLNLDGKGQHDIVTGIGFFDHMLMALAVHGGFDLTVHAQGDLHVDGHHTVEDVGIVLGQALKDALGDRKNIKRFGNSLIPMDETLARAVVDVSGRPFLVFEAQFSPLCLGTYDPSLTVEFFRAVAHHSELTIHLAILYGDNDHHKTEALFKAFAHSLKVAVALNESDVLSTKGVL